MRTSVAAAAMAASLTLGGAAGAVLFTPTLSGAQTEETTEDRTDAERPRLRERLRDELQPLVDDGTIDAGQADAVAEHLAERAPLRHRHGGFGPAFGDAVADVLGLTVDDLRARLADGESLADIAAAEGVDVQAVVDAVVAAHQQRLDEAVADARLTQEEADEKATELEQHAQDLVERTFEPGRHRPGHRHGPFAGDDTTDS